MYGFEFKIFFVVYGVLGIFWVVVVGIVKYYEIEFYDILVWWVYWGLKSFLLVEINVVNINFVEYLFVF